MNNKEFINEAFTKAIKMYLESIEKPNGVLYNSFLVVTIRVLVLIYGKLDIINPYYLDNTAVFLENLAKYGATSTELAVFKEDFLAFYNFEVNNEKRKIKIKNPYFEASIKHLIDLFVYKKRNGKVNFKEEEKFLELIYTSNTKNAYRLSYAYLMLDDTNIPEKYYYSKVNAIDMTRDLSKTISEPLNLEALNMAGINLSKIKNMSNEDIHNAKNTTYNYFGIDATKVNRDIKLDRSIDYYKMFGSKITSGNGYVDILLLMSIIVTTFSVIAIIIFNFI